MARSDLSHNSHRTGQSTQRYSPAGQRWQCVCVCVCVCLYYVTIKINVSMGKLPAVYGMDAVELF